MNTFKYCSIAAFSLVLVSSAFAQSTSTDATMPSSTSSMPSSTMPSDTTSGENRAGYGQGNPGMSNPNSLEQSPNSGSTSTYNQRDSANDNSGYAGNSGTAGGYASGAGRPAYRQSNSQMNPNDVHATPHPSSQDYHLYSGN
jgi:hypothetical protein